MGRYISIGGDAPDHGAGVPRPRDRRKPLGQNLEQFRLRAGRGSDGDFVRKNSDHRSGRLHPHDQSEQNNYPVGVEDGQRGKYILRASTLDFAGGEDMTWYFDPSGETFDLYDHNGDLVAEGVVFSGSWTDECPQEVYEEIDKEAVKAYRNNNTSRMLQCLRHGAFELIEEGIPP